MALRGLATFAAATLLFKTSRTGTSETALFSYKVSGVYAPVAEESVRWGNPERAINLPVGRPILAE